jgi:hypothetical protein
MVTVSEYSPARLRRSPAVRRFAVVYVVMIACTLLIGLLKQVVGFSDALATGLAIGLVVLFAIVGGPIIFLAPHLHPNRDRPGARPPIPILRIPLARYGRLTIDILTIGVSAIAIVQGPAWVLALVIPLLIAVAFTFWRNDARVLEDLAVHVLNRHPDHEQ